MLPHCANGIADDVCLWLPVLLRGLKRGTNMKAYGTTKLWEIMVSMELNER